MVIACFFGIGFGVSHFAKTGTNNKGTSFSDGLQTKLEVALDQNLTDAQNLKVVEQIADNITNQVKLLGANQIKVESAIEKTNAQGAKPVTYGAIYMYTEQNIPGYPIDFDTATNKEKSLIQQKLKLYYALTNSYKYQLENPYIFYTETPENKENNSDSGSSGGTTNYATTTNTEPSVQTFNKVYDLNTANTQAVKKDSNVDFTLKNPTNDQKAEQWNLSNFQKQFTSVYSWDGKTKRSQVVSDNTDTSKLKAPNEQYLLWTNRTGLINRLELDATIGTLYANQANITGDGAAEKVQIIRDIYNALSPEDQNFADFAGNNNVSGGYAIVMGSLIEANKNDFGFQPNPKFNGDPNTTKKDSIIDPLLYVLNQYYSSSVFKKFNNNQAFAADYSFLYSWNFSKLNLVNSYFTPIDYNNFFDYFTDNTDKKETSEIKNEYYSKDFSISEIGKSNSQIADLVSNLNNGYISQPINNQTLIAPYWNASTNVVNLTNCYNAITNFLSQSVNSYKTTVKNSVTTLNAFNGTLVGLSVLILLVGIIVSVIYRVPGVLNFITAALSFALSLAMFASLHMLFSVDTYVALFVSIIAMFIPFMGSQLQLRKAIKEKQLNLMNAFIYSLKSFIKTGIIVYVAMIVVSLVFLFFGTYQIKGFGSMLILTSFANIVSCGFIYILLYAFYYWSWGSINPRSMLTRSYVDLIKQINTMSFGQHELNVKQTWVDKLSGSLSLGLVGFKWWIWLIFGLFTILGIVGCILLATIGPGYSVYFKDSTELVLTFGAGQQVNAYQVADYLATHLNIQWAEQHLLVNVYNANDPNAYVYQLELISKSQLDIQATYQLLSSNADVGGVALNTWLPMVSFRTTSDAMPIQLLQNAIYCMLIALGFLAILSILTLNFMNFLSIFVISALANVITFGIVGIVRLPVDINSILMMCAIFALSQMMIYAIYSNMKFEFDMKARYTLSQMMKVVMESAKSMLLVMTGLFMIFTFNALIMMIFTSESFVYNQLILFVCSIVLYLVVVIACPTLFGLSMMLREIYLSKVVTNKKLRIKHKEYDRVDEQEIYGINHH